MHACLQLDATVQAVYTACGSLLVIIYPLPVIVHTGHSLEGRSLAIHAALTALQVRGNGMMERRTSIDNTRFWRA